MSDWQQKVLGLEPPSRVHDDVVRPRRIRIDDETIDVAEVLAGRAFDIHPVEIDDVVVQIAASTYFSHGRGRSTMPPFCAVRVTKVSKMAADGTSGISWRRCSMMRSDERVVARRSARRAVARAIATRSPIASSGI